MAFSFLPPQEGRQLLLSSNFPFFVFKISDILYVLFYTYIISLKVIKHVVFCGHLWLLLK